MVMQEIKMKETMKKRLSLSISKELLDYLDELRYTQFHGIMSRSAIIEYYIREGLKESGQLPKASVTR
jgi:metal-responsive CopG/Arc/MetJ family transcriptional regulator